VAIGAAAIVVALIFLALFGAPQLQQPLVAWEESEPPVEQVAFSTDFDL